MKLKNLTLNVENDTQLNKFFTVVNNMMAKMPAFEKLIDEATKAGPITVDFVNKGVIPFGGRIEEKSSWYEEYNHKGIVTKRIDTLERFIKVVKENKPVLEIFEVLVFELCNGKNTRLMLNSPDKIQAHDCIDRNDYGKKIEIAEYEGTQIPSRQILKEIFSNPEVAKIFSQNGFAFKAQDIANLSIDFFGSVEGWLRETNKSGHTDSYRREYDRLIKEKAPKKQVPVQPQLSLPLSSVPVQQPKKEVPVQVQQPIQSQPVLPSVPVQPVRPTRLAITTNCGVPRTAETKPVQKEIVQPPVELPPQQPKKQEPVQQVQQPVSQPVRPTRFAITTNYGVTRTTQPPVESKIEPKVELKVEQPQIQQPQVDPILFSQNGYRGREQGKQNRNNHNGRHHKHDHSQNREEEGRHMRRRHGH